MVFNVRSQIKWEAVPQFGAKQTHQFSCNALRPLLVASSCFLFSSVARFHRGDVLITTATGVMTDEEGEKWGLVPTHAYAVLDIREHKVSARRVALAC